MLKSKYTILFVLLALSIAAVALNSTSLNLSAPFSANVGDNVPISAKLTNGDAPVSGQLIDFTVEGTAIGTSVSNAEGEAMVVWQASEEGHNEISATFQGNEELSSSFDITAVNVLDSALREEKQCQTLLWQEESPVMGTCDQEYERKTCADEPFNTSCTTQTYVHTFPCVVSHTYETKSKEQCIRTGYVIADSVKLSSKDYGCSAVGQGTDVIVTCDSSRDGNADGVCADNGGESCTQYIVHADGSVEQYERNSQLEFVESSEHFFLEKPQVEVLP